MMNRIVKFATQTVFTVLAIAVGTQLPNMKDYFSSPGVVARDDNGQSVYLYPQVGSRCVAPARRAVYEGQGKVLEGCWLSNGMAVRIVFSDGDVTMIPIDAFEKAE